MRRYDSDNDGGLSFTDMVNALQTMTNYQKKEEPTLRIEKENVKPAQS